MQVAGLPFPRTVLRFFLRRAAVRVAVAVQEAQAAVAAVERVVAPLPEQEGKSVMPVVAVAVVFLAVAAAQGVPEATAHGRCKSVSAAREWHVRSRGFLLIMLVAARAVVSLGKMAVPLLVVSVAAASRA